MSATPASSRMRSRPHPHPRRLPVALTPLVGREHEVADARRLLENLAIRLLTLTGPGGVGKTRLAIRLVDDMKPDVGAHDGQVVFVALAPIHDPLLVVPTIAQALDLRDEGSPPLLDRLVSVLRLRPTLLVLDNVEQVVDAAPEIGYLLAACPELTILATSRIPLRIEGEQEYPVPPLTVPDDSSTVTPEAIMLSDAVALFVRRTQAVRPDFRLTPDNAAIVAAICQRLDGLPLAIELAAACSRSLAPRALLSRLDQRLALLTSGPRTAPQRHQTMRNAISWSDSLLSPALRQLFHQISVFVGGWPLEAAETVVDPSLQMELDGGVLGGIAALVEQSLVHQVEQPDGEPRFHLLETIREYALEQLDASDHTTSTRSRHTDWCRSLALAHWRASFGPGQMEATTILLREIDNLRAALRWAVSQPDRSRAVEIAGGLATFWFFHGNWSEGLSWLDRAWPGIDTLDDATRCLVLIQSAILIAQARNDAERAITMCNEAAELAIASGDNGLLIRARTTLGAIELGTGDHAGAERSLHHALAVEKSEGHTLSAGLTLCLLGRAVYARGDNDTAAALLEESLEISQRVNNPIGIAWSLISLARIARDRHEWANAARLLAASLEARWTQGYLTGCLACLRGLADVAISTGRYDEAARFLAATEALAESTGTMLTGKALERFQQVIDDTRTGLEPERFAAVWTEGRSAPVDLVIAGASEMASRLASEETSRAIGPEGIMATYGLSAREIDVLRLIAVDHSTAEIAEQLFISPRTVTTHLTSIYNKLGFNTRVAAARFAAEHGLV